MTTEQIASIERHLAEKVMGWIWRRPVKGSQHRWVLPPGSAQPYPPKDWHPCSNPAHAAMVRERMRELGKFMQIIYHSDCVEAHVGWADANAPTESEASSVAAALATGLKLEDE